MSKNLSLDFDIDALSTEIASTITISDTVCQSKSKYSKLHKIQAVSIYIASGKIKLTHQMTGIPLRTLQEWVSTDWWRDCHAQVRALNTNLINARTTHIISQAFDSVQERFAVGDYATYDAELREIVYKPVSAKDSAIIFGVMFDKQRINNSLATSINYSTTTHLIDVQQQFNAISQSTTVVKDISTIEHDDVHNK